jgi:hemolysin activation/secretion protein
MRACCAENAFSLSAHAREGARMTIRRAALVIFAAFLAASPGIAAAAQRPSNAALGAVVINGSSAYAAPQLFAAYHHQLGGAITRDSARAIATAVTELYVRDGYVRPELSVDDALVARGVLRLDVYEARVSRVVFEGERGRHADSLDRIASRLTAAAPLRGDDVSGALRDMRALPGITVNASTRRDASIRNAFELVVQTGFSPVDGVVRVNNRGTDEVGPAFALGQLYLNGVLGDQGRLGLVFATAIDPEEYLGLGLSAEASIDDQGTRAHLLLFQSRSEPNEAPVNLADRYERERFTLRLSNPFVNGSRASLNFSVGIEVENLQIERDGDRVRDDRLRIFATALRGSLRMQGGTQLSANLQLRKGLDGLGAGLAAADMAQDLRRADFFVTQLQTTVQRRFATRWTARLDTLAQYSGHVLPDSERFKIGGDRLGRGFEVAEIAGDSGLGGKVELRRDLLETTSFVGRLSTYGFYDIGAAWKQSTSGHESAATAGLGFGMTGAALTGYFELATPVQGPDIEGKRDASFFAELSWRF